MKILHWKRILLDKPAEGAETPPPTIWECVTEPEFDRAGLEASFAQLPSKGADAADSASSKPKPAVTKALDPKRSNAVAIMMSSLPPVNDVKAAIANLDEDVLSREQLEKIRANIATPEEMEQINALDGPHVKWDKPEQFLKVIMNIPKVRMRLRCWSIKYGFGEKSEEVEELLKTVSEAINELRNSRSLRTVLSALLALGNHLNGGTNKGQADGFALGDLGKMSVTKDNSNTVSLLEYAVQAMHASEEHAHAMLLPEELAHLREAGKIKIADVRGALQKLVGEAKELQTSAKSAAADTQGDSGDPFTVVMQKFAEVANAEVQRLRDLLDHVDSSYAALLTYFKIRPGKGHVTESDELFTLLHEFSEAFKALVPKPKPLKQLTRNANVSVAQDRPSVIAGADELGELDPMLSRIQGVKAADGRPPESTRRVRAPSGADATRSRVESISDLARNRRSSRAPSVVDRQHSSLRAEDDTGTRSKNSKAVDQKYEARLAARFAKAKPPR